MKTKVALQGALGVGLSVCAALLLSACGGKWASSRCENGSDSIDFTRCEHKCSQSSSHAKSSWEVWWIGSSWCASSWWCAYCTYGAKIVESISTLPKQYLVISIPNTGDEISVKGDGKEIFNAKLETCGEKSGSLESLCADKNNILVLRATSANAPVNAQIIKEQ